MGSSSPSQPNRLLLIDGHSMAYRAYFALPVDNFATATGQHTNAVFGFVSMLINLLRDEKPTHVAVAFDVSRHTFRTDRYPAYKATRSESPAPFKGQVDLVKEVLDALRIVRLDVEGFEADDIIATLACQASAKDMDVLVCTGDRDALQLVNDQVTVLYPRKGVSDLVRMDPAVVEAKYGVSPQRYPELAALVGETSDNLVGVPGVGPKTAAKWLAQWDGLSNLLANVDQVKGKVGEALREHATNVAQNRSLNALVTDVELPVGVSDLVVQPWDREAVHTLFDALEFRVLRDRWLEAFPDSQEPTQAAVAVEVHTPQGAATASWLADHATGVCGVDITGTWAGGSGSVDTIGICGPSGVCAAWAMVDLDEDTRSALVAWFADEDCGKVLHDAKGPMGALLSAGFELRGLVADTALMAYLCHPDQRSYQLSDLCVRYLQREIDMSAPTDAGQLSLNLDADDQQWAQRIGVRVSAVRELYPVLDEELQRRSGSELLKRVELPLMSVLTRMERTGIACDAEQLRILDQEFAQHAAVAAQAAYEIVGHEVNLGSPKQLQVVLFEQFDMPKTKKIKTGYSTDAESLQDLLDKTGHPFLQHLLDHRDVTKLRQTVQGLLKSIGSDGRIHTTYQQMIAATGRLSSADPNLQNIPIRTAEGRRIRSVFVPGEGYDSLLSADYSQVEMRIMAHLSQDEGLVEAFTSGEDLHSFVGGQVFNVDPDEVTPAMRAKVKAMSYGLVYGLSAFGLAKQLRIEVDEARELMEEYFKRFGGVRDYLQGVVEDARVAGYTETLEGRRRYLPDLNSDNRQRREMAERMALNAPIQGSAADIIKIAMIRLDQAFADQSLRSRMLLQVHDELVVEVAPGEQEVVTELVTTVMSTSTTLTVPLDVSVGIGKSWQDAH